MVVEQNKANSTDTIDKESRVAAASAQEENQPQPQEKLSIQDTNMGQCLKQQMESKTVECSKSSKGSSATGQVGLGPIPKKRKSPKNAAAPVPKKTKNSQQSEPRPLGVGALSVMAKLTPDLTCLGQGKAWSVSSTTLPAPPQEEVGNRQSFEIEFDCNKPLGFYSVTERKTGNYCKIMYVAQKGLALLVFGLPFYSHMSFL